MLTDKRLQEIERVLERPVYESPEEWTPIDFIVYFKTAVPELLEEVKGLREEVTYWIKKHDALLSDSAPKFENISEMVRRAIGENYD